MKLQREMQINNLNDLCVLMCGKPEVDEIYSYCLRCGKPLRSEESKLKGYGKTCERKAKCEDKLKLF